MVRKYILPLLAIAGFVFAARVVIMGSKPIVPAQPVAQPAEAPYQSTIAGAGLIEASTENIAVGASLSGIVTEVLVQVGDRVKSEQPLFKIDDRDLKATLEVRKASLAAAQAQLERLKSMPRPEDLPPAQARLTAAEAALADVTKQLGLAEGVTIKGAIAQEEMVRRRSAVEVERARVKEAKSELELLKAGSWKADIAVQEAQVAQAEAQVRQTETDLERLVVRAPIDGEVLQVKIRKGEYAPAGVALTPLILIGNLDLMHVRVDIDENDAWRFRPNAAASATVRGNAELKTPLKYVRTEPFIIPKRSLTGDATERVDTRVMQAVYSFECGSLPVYVGQQMDVFIETAATPDKAVATAGPTK